MSVVGQLQSSDLARDGYREITLLGEDGILPVHVRVRSCGCSLPEINHFHSAVGQTDGHEATATDTCSKHIDSSNAKARSDGGIHCVAAVFQHYNNRKCIIPSEGNLM